MKKTLFQKAQNLFRKLISIDKLMRKDKKTWHEWMWVDDYRNQTKSKNILPNEDKQRETFYILLTMNSLL